MSTHDNARGTPDQTGSAAPGFDPRRFKAMERAGFKVDLSHPCSKNTVKWREPDLIQPLDTSRIEAWDDILPGLKAMKDLMTDDEGTAWFVPFDWGNTLVTYRTDKIEEAEIQSLQAFADPKFEGRVSLPDNVDDQRAGHGHIPERFSDVPESRAHIHAQFADPRL